MEKLYKYVGILVVSLLVVTFLIRLFHLNTQVIEGLTVKQVKEQKEEEEKELEKQEGTPLEKVLLKTSKMNEDIDKAIKAFALDDKEVTEDILLELDEYCDKVIMVLIIRTVGDGEVSFSHNGKKLTLDDKTLHQIEQFTSLKKAVAQCMKYVTSNTSSSKPSENSLGGGMFS